MRQIESDRPHTGLISEGGLAIAIALKSQPFGPCPQVPSEDRPQHAAPEQEAASILREFEAIRPKLFIRRKAMLELAHDILMNREAHSPDVHVVVRQRQNTRRITPGESARRIDSATCDDHVG